MNVIDSLVVTLGLDSSKFKAGSKDIGTELKKTKEGADQSAKQIELSGKKGADSLHSMRNAALGLLSAFAAGAIAHKLIAAATDTSTAATGRLATNIEMTTEALSAWQMATERNGGSAEATAGSFRTLSAEIQAFRLTGQSSVIPFFNRLGVAMLDSKLQARNLGDIYLDIARSPIWRALSPQEKTLIGGGFGMDQGMINLLSKGDVTVKSILAEMERVGTITRRDAEAAQQLYNEWLNVKDSIVSVIRTISTTLSPSMIKLLKHVNEWLQATGPDGRSNIERLGKAFDEWADSPSWDKIDGRLQSWFKIFLNIARFLGITDYVPPTAPGAAPQATGQNNRPNALGYVPNRNDPNNTWNMWEKFDRDRKERAKQLHDEWIKAHPQGGGLREWWHRQFGHDTVADQTMTPEQSRFLNTIAGPESGGKYNVRYTPGGGTTFDDLSKHPNIPELITSGPHKGETSTAAGKYQFLKTTWDRIAGELGLTDFSPASQDKAAWHLAATTYFQKTRRALLADLQEGGHGAEIAGALKGQWDSLPGGGQPGITPSAFIRGLGGNKGFGPLVPVPGAPTVRDYPGAGQQAANSNATEINIGSITIQTAATDAPGIARDLGESLRRYGFVPQADYGLA